MSIASAMSSGEDFEVPTDLIGGLDDAESDSDDDPSPLAPPNVSEEMNAAFENMSVGGDPLHDKNWVEERNERLIFSMLDLDQPAITDQMVGFLGTDAVMDILLQCMVKEDFEWNAGDADVVRLGTDEAGWKDMERSYKVTMLLSGDGEKREPRHSFVTDNIDVIVKSVMKCFGRSSGANLHHTIHLLTALLTTLPDKVIDIIGRNSNAVKRNFGAMLNCIGFDCVERFLTEICCMRGLECTTDRLWKFSCALSDWKMILEITSVVYDEEKSDDEANAASRIITELVNTLSTHDSGEILLSPIGYCPELTTGLIEGACRMDWSLSRRCDCARVLLEIAQRSREDEITIQATQSQFMMSEPTPIQIANKLKTVKELILQNILNDMPKICACLTTANASPGTLSDLRHPGRIVVSQGFTVARLMLVSLIAEMAERSDDILDKLEPAVWERLARWFFEYSENNMYHVHFYRILFKALRSNHEKSLMELLKTNKFISECLHAFDEKKSAGKFFNRGSIIKCCNAIRLQMTTLAPSALMRSFLLSHDGWKNFQGKLKAITKSNLDRGMGITVPSGGMGIENYMNQNNSNDLSGDHMNIEIGSEFARDMGFEDEIAWPDETEVKKKKKKKKKRKKKKKGESSGESGESSASEAGEEDGDDCEDDE